MSGMMSRHKPRWVRALALAWLAFAVGACSSTYYATWETLGKHKRDLLKDNVEAAREEQGEAQQQFKDALTRLKELRNFEGGELEKAYNTVSDDYEECNDRAEALRSRIATVEEIAADLFKEWETEIGQMTNPTFQADSRKKLAATRKKYRGLQQAMTAAEKRMDPVLVKFRDYVLYLKHNLNAQAVGSLTAEVASIETEVGKLIADMQKSIAQADEFIKTM